jgi:hypothetical protein
MQAPKFLTSVSYRNAVEHIVVTQGFDALSGEALRFRVQELLLKVARKSIKQAETKWIKEYNQREHQRRLSTDAYLPSYGTVIALRNQLTPGMDRRVHGKGRSGVNSNSRYNFKPTPLRKAA